MVRVERTKDHVAMEWQPEGKRTVGQQRITGKRIVEGKGDRRGVAAGPKPKMGR